MVMGRMPHKSDGVPDAARQLAREWIRAFREALDSGEWFDVAAVQMGLATDGMTDAEFALLVAGLLMHIHEAEQGEQSVSHH